MPRRHKKPTVSFDIMDFTWDAKNEILVEEASTLGLRSALSTFTITDKRAPGEELDFEFDHLDTTDGGEEIAGWRFIPITEGHSNKDKPTIKGVLIIND